MQELTSIYKDENNLPLPCFLSNDGKTVHILKFDSEEEVFNISFDDYLVIKAWMNL